MANDWIRDETEAVLWLAEARPLSWMVEEYARKYNVRTTVDMWLNFRRRQGFAPRTVHDDALVPWFVQPEHRWSTPLAMLTLTARDRAGLPVPREQRERLRVWIEGLQSSDSVVHYDAEQEGGWSYVPRRPGIDHDLIRVPDAQACP